VQHEWRDGGHRHFLAALQGTQGGLGVQTTCIDVHITHFITTKAIKRGSSESDGI